MALLSLVGPVALFGAAKKKCSNKRPEPPIAAVAPLAADGSGSVVAAVAMKRLRGTPYAQGVTRLLGAFHDFKTYLWRTDLSPAETFEWVVIATDRPSRVTHTTLVITHDLPTARLKAAVNSSARHKDKGMRWKKHPAGLLGTAPSPPALPRDERHLLLQKGAVLVGPIPKLARLAGPARAAEGRKGEPAKQPAAAQAHLKRITEALAQGLPSALKRSGGSAAAPAFLLRAVGLKDFARFPAGLPVPERASAWATAASPVKAAAVAAFAEEKEAKAFIASLTRRIARARQSLLVRVLGFADLFGRLELKQAGKEVRAMATITRDEMLALLDLARDAVPPVYVPGMPQRTLGVGGREASASRPRRGPP